MRLDYVKNLGVKGVRLNSIFPAPNYPEHYFNVTSLTAINTNLGTMDDFDDLVREIHSRNMTIILDLPLYPFIKNLDDAYLSSNDAIRWKRNVAESSETLPSLPSTITPSHQAIRVALLSMKLPDESSSTTKKENLIREHMVTESIKFWAEKGVDGFYLKGLEHFVHDESFTDLIM